MGSFSRFAVRIGAFLLGVMALAAAPAHAEREPSANNSYWNVINAGGCSLILNSGALYLEPDGRHVEGSPEWPATITWKGPCGANGLANGRGTMTIAVFYKERNFSTDYRSSYTGEMRDGVMSGAFSIQTLNNDGTGKYTSDYPAESTTYTNGCDSEWDFDMECRLAGAQALQARFGAGGSSGGAATAGSTYSGGSTFTTVGGTAVAPQKFAAPQESALATVADGLVTALGGRSGLGFSTGTVTVNDVLAALRRNLTAQRGAALGGKVDMLDVVMGEVRKALGGANPASTNGQIADLVMDTVRLALSSGGSSTQAAGAPLPAPGPVEVAVPPSIAPPSRIAAVAGNTRSAVSAPAPVASSKMVSAADVQSVIAYIATKGDGITRKTDSSGNPQLGETNGYYQVYFLDCNDSHDQCQTLQFNACYSNYQKANVTKTNEWNSGYAKIKSYIDSNGWVCIDQTVPTGIGGIGYEAMDISFDAFLYFRQHADEQFK